MKFKFSLKNKELGFDADVERLIEKQLDNKKEKPAKKSRYQIKQEEKRKNKELKFKQQQMNKEQEFKQTKRTVIMLTIFLIIMLLICLIGSFIEKL